MENVDINKIRLRGLKGILRKMEESCRVFASRNTNKILELYKKLPESRNGRYINSDLMKMTFPFYAKSAENREKYNLSITNSAAVLTAEAYNRAIKDPKVNKCIYIAGPYGAGKTYFVQSLFEGEKDPQNPKKRKSPIEEGTIVYEGSITLPAFGEKIRKAKENNVEPLIIVINPTLELSMRNIQKRAKETGRDVIKQEVVDKYQELKSNLEGILEEFGDIPYVIYNKKSNKEIDLNSKSTDLNDLDHGTKEEISKEYDEIKEKLEKEKSK